MTTKVTDLTRPASIRRGRPARISQAQIVEAAIELGIESFSMQGIAEHLGVTPPALYTHVSGRDEVLDLLAADLIARLTVPVSERMDWRTWLLEYGRLVRRHLAGAGLSLQVDLSGPLGADKLRAAEGGLSLLMRAGFDPADAGLAIWLVFRVALTAGPASDASVTVAMAEAERAFDPSTHPATGRALAAISAAPHVDTFEFDLRVVIAGLDAARRQHRSNQPVEKEPSR